MYRKRVTDDARRADWERFRTDIIQAVETHPSLLWHKATCVLCCAKSLSMEWSVLVKLRITLECGTVEISGQIPPPRENRGEGGRVEDFSDPAVEDVPDRRVIVPRVDRILIPLFSRELHSGFRVFAFMESRFRFMSRSSTTVTASAALPYSNSSNINRTRHKRGWEGVYDNMSRLYHWRLPVVEGLHCTR